MMGSTHRIGGMLAGFLAAGQCQDTGAGSLVILAGALAGSLLPDIDNPHSTISGKLPVLSLAVNTGQGIIRAASRLLPGRAGKNIRSMAGHRGIFHSLFFPALLLILCRMKPGAAMWGLLAGMLSHLLLDALAGGVPLFMPFSVKRIRIAGIKTGGAGEKIFRCILAAAAAAGGIGFML